jgi:hypothetical protein
MPGSVGINFNGAYIVKPGVYSNIDCSAMVPQSSGPGGNVGVIGMSDGGVPGQVYAFTSLTQAQRVLRQGPILSYLSRIFAPSSDPSMSGASQVLFQRLVPAANPVTQANLTINGLLVTSRDYGRHTNGITVAIVAGAVTGTWNVTIAKASDGYSRTYTVGLALSVQSSVPTPQVVFDHVNREASLYSNNTLVAQLAYPDDTVTVANLVSFINGQAGWSAIVTGDGSMPLRYMDNPEMGTSGTSEDETVIATTMTPLYACQGGLVWALQSNPIVSAALVSGVSYGPLTGLATTPLTGAAGTAMDTSTASDYISPLAAFETQDIQHLFLASSDPNVHALGYQHVLAMWGLTRRRERILYAGGPVGQIPAQAIAQVQALGGPVIYPWNGTYASNPISGVAENLGGIGTAAQVCGMAAGCAEAVPLTYKMLVASALEVPSPTDSDIDSLLVGGVSPVAYDPSFGDPIIIQAITTYQGGSNVAYRKLQGLRIQMAIKRGFRSILAQFLGSEIDLITANRIKAATAKFLDDSTVSSSNPSGFLTQGLSGGKVTPAWDSLAVTTDGMQTWNLLVNVHPVGESDYLGVNIFETPAQIEV